MKEISQSSYRDYLKHWFDAESTSGKPVSLRAFSSKLGISESSLRMILSGERNLTIHNVHVIAEGLRLSPAQTEIFEAMVLRDQAETESETKYYAKRLQQKAKEYGLSQIKLKESDVLKQWFGPALLIYLRENGLTPEKVTPQEAQKLAKRLGLAVEQLEQSLKLYSEQGYLEGTPQKNEHLRLDKLTTSKAQIEYVKKNLQVALQRVERDYKTGASLFSVQTISVEESRLREFGAEYKALLEKYMVSPPDKTLPGQSHSVFQIVFSALKVL